MAGTKSDRYTFNKNQVGRGKTTGAGEKARKSLNDKLKKGKKK